ncbi:MAG: YHYH protein [Deltaproteobacteria bacterium]|nr:YHYH protein [bacterium]MCB9477569.1 YHYH protein [Deltaproteobacteria bacterium]MCB9487671.1 YHYH protein [Deltaproteobacteria bacterium]
MRHLPKSLFLMLMIFAVVAMCGWTTAACEIGGDDDDDNVGDDDDDATNPNCDVDPICDAFYNDGSQGGELEVVIDDTEEYAIVSTNSLAEHEMGPFDIGPGEVVAQDLTFYIPLEPTSNPGSVTPLGPMAVAYNGVALFNPWDAVENNGCNNNAYYIRARSFDRFGGHPQQTGMYHYHVGTFLNYADELGIHNSTDWHSPILGYSFDGYPIYGPYGYSDPEDSSSPIVLLESCYELQSERTCCTDNSSCGTNAYFEGTRLVMGAFVEDYAYEQDAYDAGACDLNAYNMRWQVTPEYPDGTWAYIMTMKDETPVYPYIIGMNYYGNPSESGINNGPPA